METDFVYNKPPPPFLFLKIDMAGAIYSLVLHDIKPASNNKNLLRISSLHLPNRSPAATGIILFYCFLPFKESQDKDLIFFFLVAAEGQMGKKSWFSAMKKAVGPCIPMSKKKKRSHKSKSNQKNSRHGNQMSLVTCSSTLSNPFHHYHPMEFKLPENEQIKHVDSITYTAKVNFTKSNSCCLDKTKEEISAIKIQTDYRGYLARRVFRSLRAMSRLNLWIRGQAVKHQTTSTLTRMQTMGRIRSQVRTRGIRMAQVNETLQRQLVQKRKTALDKGFDLSPKSKEQVDAISKNKKEVAERREKALAYAYTRQQTWRNSQKSSFVEPNRLALGWSWSHRWETGTTSNKALSRSKSANSKAMNSKLQISKLGRSPLAKN